MNFHVIIPHYRAQHWLRPCVTLLQRLASGLIPIQYDILTMDDEPIEIENVTVYRFPQPGKIGGQPLPEILLRGTHMTDAAITITVDPDTLMLCPDWDLLVASKFYRSSTVVAGINPRSDTGDFAGVPEWNWMAFKTEYWLEHVRTFQPNRCDIGHLFADAAARTGHDMYLWPLVRHPYPGKAASIVGDKDCGEFVFHAFYSTRKREDRIPDSERTGILTESEETEMIRWAFDRSFSAETTCTIPGLSKSSGTLPLS
jgi:hypothetical protein